MSLKVVTVSFGLPALRGSSKLSLEIPADISDDVCEHVRRTLLTGLLRPTLSSNNEASKVLKMHSVSMN